MELEEVHRKLAERLIVDFEKEAKKILTRINKLNKDNPEEAQEFYLLYAELKGLITGATIIHSQTY